MVWAVPSVNLTPFAPEAIHVTEVRLALVNLRLPRLADCNLRGIDPIYARVSALPVEACLNTRSE